MTRDTSWQLVERVGDTQAHGVGARGAVHVFDHHAGRVDNAVVLQVPLIERDRAVGAAAAVGAEVHRLADAWLERVEVVARLAQIVHLRFFAGLSVDEAAETLGLSARTVKREWAVARAWLFQRMS